MASGPGEERNGRRGRSSITQVAATRCEVLVGTRRAAQARERLGHSVPASAREQRTPRRTDHAGRR